MENQFNRLKGYHEQKKPLLIYNCWDVGSAKLMESKGATVIGTSSYAFAETLGYNDGESVPFSDLIVLSERLVAATSLPVTIDAEGLYAQRLETLSNHAERLIQTGISGFNFEDQLVKAGAVTRWSLEEQVQRIRLIKEVAAKMNVAIFLNARTDVFFQSRNHQQAVVEAIARGRAYAKAGADGFFIPGTFDSEIVRRVVNEVPLPVNIMIDGDAVARKKWCEIGVKRMSTGPHTYLANQERLAKNLTEVMAID